jgi:hypothetical protein
MKRISAILAALTLLLAMATPVLAADFPDQANLHSCDVVTSLPFDVIGHLFQISPEAAQLLLDLVTDACG